MSVITISRESFSGGDLLAECLSAELGYRCIDREVIVERAAAHGVSQEELRDALQKPPTFLERIQHKKYLYLVLMQAALIEEVRTGNAVYHGNAGHLLLKNGPRILRARIIAPLETRLTTAQDRLKLSRAEALEHVEKMDQDRRRWAQYLYGVDWRDASNYDVVLNLESMGIPEACQAVSTLARQQCFEFTPACQAAMDDVVLASQVRTELALNETTSHMEVEVTAKERVVRIVGSVSSIWEVEEVRLIAASVPGVESVNLDELASPARP
jgi:cytidylate kinase